MPSDGYLLARGCCPSIRLNLQHYFWKDALGYLIHPSFPLEDVTPFKIADIGTGTGIWLLDLAKSLPPSVQLDSFDLSNAQFPAREHLPTNVHLHILDSLNDEPPAHLLGQYDIVHLRLFVDVIRNNDPSALISHCLKLLRPGGLLQWGEFDPLRTEGHPGKNGLAPNTVAVAKLLRDLKPHSWVQKLQEYFIENKLDNVKMEFNREHAWQRKLISDTVVALAEEVVATSFEPDSEEAMRTLEVINNSYTEICQGAFISEPFVVVTGRKPSI